MYVCPLPVCPVCTKTLSVGTGLPAHAECGHEEIGLAMATDLVFGRCEPWVAGRRSQIDGWEVEVEVRVNG